MNTVTRALRKHRYGLVSGLLMVLSLGQTCLALAQDKSDRKKTYAIDRQTCLEQRSGQELAPCLKEAGAVLTQRDGLGASVSPEQLQRNRLMRCDAFKGDDHADCIARTQGMGTVTGSVGGGGILRELVTTTTVTRAP